MPRRYLIPFWVLVVVTLLLVAVHLLLPYLIERYLNRQMADMGDYRGHVEDVDVEWWRGAYRIEGLQVVRVDEKLPVPFLDIPGIDIAVSWRALLQHGRIETWITFDRPALNFVAGPVQQTGAGVDWRRQAKQFFPVVINEIRVLEGSVRFQNFTSEPPVDMRVTSIHAHVFNLTNVAGLMEQQYGRMQITGQALGDAPLESYATFNPLPRLQNFDFRLRLRNVDLTHINDFARAYGNFDFAEGNGDLVMEAHVRDRQLDGYIKLLLQNVGVFEWRQDVVKQEQGLLKALWEGMVGAAQEVLENQDEDQFATRVELKGTLGDQEVSAWQAFVAILRNAFIEAFAPTFGGDAPSD